MDKQAAKSRFADLKFRLAELGYNEVLGSIESLDLIEHLLTDVKNISASYKQVSEKENRLANDLALAQAQLFPLRKENARLARENHDLHVDHIKQNDTNRATVDEYNRKIRAIENDNGQLKLKLEAMSRHVADHESHLNRIREAYSDVSDPKGKKNQKKDMDISRRLPSNGSFVTSPINAVNQKQEQQWLSIDNSVVDTLRDQVDTLSAALKKSEEEIKRLNTAIASREQELSRSSKFISIVSSNYVDTSEVNPSNTILPSNRSEQLLAADVANKRIIDQLNGQVDFLNEQLAAKEQQLVEVGDKLRRFDAVQMELSQRTILLDQTRKENAQLTSHLRQMEEKLLDTQLQCEQLAKNQSSSSSVSIAVPESKTNDEDKHALLHQINVITAEKNELAVEIQRLQKIVEELDAKQSASTLATWKKGVKGAKIQQDMLVSDLNKEVENLKKKNATLSKTLTQSEERNKLLIVEKEELSKKLKFHEHTRNQNEAQKMTISLQEKLTRCEVVRDALTVDLQNAKSAYEQSTQELLSVRQQYRELLLEKEQLVLNAGLASSDLVAFRSTVSEQVAELSSLREKNSKLTLEIDDLNISKDLTEKKCVQLKSQLESTQTALANLQKQLSAKEALTISNADSASAFVIEQLRNDKKKLQEQLSQCEEERNRLELQQSSLNQVVHYLGLQQSEHEGKVNDAVEERSSILSCLREKDSEIESLKLQLETVRAESIRKTEDLESNDIAIKSLREEYLTTKLLVQQQTSRINQLLADVSLSQQRLEHVEDERDSYLNQLENLQSQGQQTAVQLTTTHQDVLLLQHQVNQLNEEKEFLQQSFADFQLQTEQMQRRGRSDKQDFQNVLKQKTELEAKLEEYKTLLNNAEATQRSAQQKFQLAQSRLKDSEDNQTMMEQENDTLKADIAKRDAVITDLRSTIEDFDQDRDLLSQKVDDLEDVLNEKTRILKQQEVDLLQCKQLIDQLQVKLNSKDKELNKVTRNNETTEDRLNSLQVEFNSLKRLNTELEGDLMNFKKDLLNMTRECQMINSELTDMTSDRDRLRVKVSELSQAWAATDQMKRVKDFEKNELEEMYNKALRDIKRLEKEVNDLSDLKQKNVQNSQQLYAEVNELHGVINGMKRNEQHWVSDKVTLNKEIEMLNEHLMRLNARVSELEDEKRKILNDANSLKSLNAQLNDRINLVLKRATAATEANKILTSTLSTVERERDAVRSLVNIERQRAVEMGQLMEAARTQAATKDIQIQSLRSRVSTDTNNVADSSSNNVEIVRSTVVTSSSHHTSSVRTVINSSNSGNDSEHIESSAHTHSD